MDELLKIAARMEATLKAKYPYALTDPDRFWAWSGSRPLLQEFLLVQRKLDEALDSRKEVGKAKVLATEWGRKYLELAKAFEAENNDPVPL